MATEVNRNIQKLTWRMEIKDLFALASSTGQKRFIVTGQIEGNSIELPLPTNVKLYIAGIPQITVRLIARQLNPNKQMESYIYEGEEIPRIFLEKQMILEIQ